MTTRSVANEEDLYFERGGPAYRLMERTGVIRGGPSLGRRIIGFWAITWVPLLLLAMIEGHALGATPRESFLLDFATYGRFFVAIPLLMAAEVIIGPRLTTAGLHFLRAGIIPEQEYPAFERAIRRAARWRESWLAELVILVIALIGTWVFTAETIAGETTSATWRTRILPDGRQTLSYAGVWSQAIAVPLLQFFWYRWLWRLIIWVRFLADVIRMKLNLIPSHADEAGGLAFLGTTHLSLGVLSFGLSAVLSAEAAFRMIYEAVPIKAFQVPFVILLITTELIILGPLLLFLPLMARQRREWLRTYGLLVTQYNREFHAKWIEGMRPTDEPLLGSADMQSLADLGSGFEFIRAMKIVPFNLKVIIQLAVMTALPGLPLILLVVPISEVLEMLSKAIL